MVKRLLCLFLSVLVILLTGTVIVLSTVVHYFGVDKRDIITEFEMKLYSDIASKDLITSTKNQSLPESESLVKSIQEEVLNHSENVILPVEAEGEETLDQLQKRRAVFQENLSGNGSEEFEGEARQRVPKIVHQTWKQEILPERWEKVRQECMTLHSDYEYKLWTDRSSREFIIKNYPWFLTTFDGYPYPIQRADAIRYFVLHHFGGIYMDLDVGCKRSIDPLLYFEIVLPATIPVGVSNDIMVAEKGHPFMDLVIHNLITFDHQYGTNYPTVMFSTGPMFLSAQYGLWPKADRLVGVERQVRVLPRKYYGKNAPKDQMQESFFEHYYGSSWHADDAWFITFLGKFGMLLMYIGLFVLIVGAMRLFWPKRFKPRIGNDITLPLHTDSRPASPSNSKSPRHSPTLSTSLLSFLPKRFFNIMDPPMYNGDNDYYQISQSYSRSTSPSYSSHRPTTTQDGPLPLPPPPSNTTTNKNKFWPFNFIWRAWIFRSKSLQQYEQSTSFIPSITTSREIKITDDRSDITRISSTGFTEKVEFVIDDSSTTIPSSSTNSPTTTATATGFRSPLPPQYSSPRSFQPSPSSSAITQEQELQSTKQYQYQSPLPEYSTGRYQRGSSLQQQQQQQQFTGRQLDYESSTGTTTPSSTCSFNGFIGSTRGEYGLGIEFNDDEEEDEKKK